MVSDCNLTFSILCVYSWVFHSYLSCYILEHIQVGTSQKLFKSNAIFNTCYYQSISRYNVHIFNFVCHLSNFLPTNYPQGRAMTHWLFVCRSYRDGTGKLYGPWEMLRPLVSTFLLFSLMVVWARVSSCQVMELQPRLFYWTTGTAFSNIAVRILYRNIDHNQER